ncbi:MAG: aminotransferase class V-fold PLP-dependent enzyme [Nitrospirales bacterium]|nr:aminotransferase class V-fold PLP-dependent enzyme [Nitrospira sp.]MDR4501656.1 aminotransferase class V-fold PLP-dependent enzyme [Nitrospirales bacterium]
MSGQKSENKRLHDALTALGPGPLDEQSLRAHLHPLFSKVLRRPEIYLANHSLGRPPDQTLADVQQAIEYWYADMEGAWDVWLAEIQTFRRQIANLIHAPSEDCIIPKTSAGQGLRAVLNCYDEKTSVVTTTAEFNSVDHILKTYAKRNRIAIHWIPSDQRGIFHEDDILGVVKKHPGSLLIVSMVLFSTGQYLTNLPAIIQEAQAQGSRVLLDLYHAVGVIPINIQALGADFAIGGCYKYLRGGPGACWLSIHPKHLDGTLSTLDTGWFAQPTPFDFLRPDSPALASGGNAFLESTPPILPYYQAKAGLAFTQGIGVDRLREYSLGQQARLTELLLERGIHVLGMPERRGAFLTVTHPEARRIAEQLKAHSIVIDARDNLLRICPDILTKDEEMRKCASEIAKITGSK